MGVERSLNLAQAAFAALPDAQQTKQEASRIARQVSKDNSLPLAPVDKIMQATKDVNKPLVNVQIGSPGERKDIAEARANLGLLDQIETLYKPEYVGFLDAKIGQFKSATGLIDLEEAEFRAATNRFLVEARHAIFGSAFTATEKKSALEALPDYGMSSKQFEASVKMTRKNLERITKERIGAIHEFGRQPAGKGGGGTIGTADDYLKSLGIGE